MQKVIKPSSIRRRLYDGIVEKNTRPGWRLPGLVMTVRAILFPLETYCLRFLENHGYNYKTDTWTIEGIKYSGSMMRALPLSDGIYRIKAENGVLTVERYTDSGDK